MRYLTLFLIFFCITIQAQETKKIVEGYCVFSVPEIESSNRIAFLEKNKKVTILDENERFYQISWKRGKMKGWILKQAFSGIKYESGSSGYHYYPRYYYRYRYY